LVASELPIASTCRIVRFRNPEFALDGDFMPGIVSSNVNKYMYYEEAAFGSAHTGTCNFVLGDGSVHGISATIDPEHLGWLGCVNDGKAVSIP
jgi:hypothetical protein